MKSALLTILLVLSVAGMAMAAPPAPARPKNPNIATPGDTPQQALCKLVAAIEAGDTVATRSYIAIDSSNDPAFADNWVAILTCTGRLDKAIREKLGAGAYKKWGKDRLQYEGLGSIGERINDIQDVIKEIESTKVDQQTPGVAKMSSLNKTFLVLLFPNSNLSMRLVDHVWKIDMGHWVDLRHGDKSKRFSDNVVMESLQSDADSCNDLAGQLEQGKLKSYNEFLKAVKKANPETPEFKPFLLPKDDSEDGPLK